MTTDLTSLAQACCGLAAPEGKVRLVRAPFVAPVLGITSEELWNRVDDGRLRWVFYLGKRVDRFRADLELHKAALRFHIGEVFQPQMWASRPFRAVAEDIFPPRPAPWPSWAIVRRLDWSRPGLSLAVRERWITANKRTCGFSVQTTELWRFLGSRLLHAGQIGGPLAAR
jgi:hypothetical protein